MFAMKPPFAACGKLSQMRSLVTLFIVIIGVRRQQHEQILASQ
jgi:hypothetical protein